MKPFLSWELNFDHMTLTLTFDLETVKTNQHAKHLHKSFGSTVIVWTHRQTNRPDWLLYLHH